MKLIVGKTAGFCFGVRNAVDKTYEQLEKSTENLYCLGELVHNERIVGDITKKGIITINEISDIPNNSNAIIRSHGVEPKIYEIAKSKNINIIDLTCPKVNRIHELAKKFCDNNFYIMLIGEKRHVETLGTKGFCGENSTIIEEIEDIQPAIQSFNESNLGRIAVIAQTTFSVEKFNNIVSKIQEETDCEIEIKNTICNATAMRQAETEELSKNVDLMIVVGGKSSANTRRLYDISCKNCKSAILIQDKDDNDLSNALRNNYDKIGLMAGASTPQESINEVAEYVNNIGGRNEYCK